MGYTKQQLEEIINQPHVLELFEIVYENTNISICPTGYTDNLDALNYDENGETECCVNELDYLEFSHRYPELNWSDYFPEPEEDENGDYILDKVVLVIEVEKKIMENFKQKCLELDKKEYDVLMVEYPQLKQYLSGITDIATTQSIEILEKAVGKDGKYRWFDNSNWFNQIHGFSSSFIETEIDLYCEEQGKSKDELTELDYEDIALEIQSSIDCNCKELNEIIETIEE